MMLVNIRRIFRHPFRDEVFSRDMSYKNPTARNVSEVTVKKQIYVKWQFDKIDSKNIHIVEAKC